MKKFAVGREDRTGEAGVGRGAFAKGGGALGGTPVRY